MAAQEAAEDARAAAHAAEMKAVKASKAATEVRAVVEKAAKSRFQRARSKKHLSVCQSTDSKVTGSKKVGPEQALHGSNETEENHLKA